MLYRNVVGRSAFLKTESSWSGLAEREIVVLCIHGMYGGAWYFSRWLEQFKFDGLGALALDLRGHRESTLLPRQKLDDVTMQDYADDVMAMVEVLRGAGVPPKRIVLLGHSMGGLVALMTAAQLEVGALVLVASAVPRSLPKYHHSFPASLILRSDKNAEIAPRIPDKERARRMFTGTPEPIMSQIVARLVPESARAQKEVANGIVIGQRVPSPPTLIISGKRDQIVPQWLAYLHHMGIPGSSHFSCNSGHFPMLEPDAEQVAHKIVLWTQKVLSRQK